MPEARTTHDRSIGGREDPEGVDRGVDTRYPHTITIEKIGKCFFQKHFVGPSRAL